MTEITRERELIVLVKGNSNTFRIDDTMAQNGWAPGQAVMWADANEDTFMLTYSDGRYGGFLYEGSNELANQYISSVGSSQKYRYATLCAGTWVISTTTYEKYTYASRISGPLVPLVYSVGERLLFSQRGLFTKEREWQLASNPNINTDLFIATVIQVPSAANKFYLMVQTSI